jgi:hypothetical protein
VELTVWPVRKNPHDVKESDEHAPDFALHRLHLFQFSVNQACYSHTLVHAHAFFSRSLPNPCQDLLHTFSEICTKFDAVPLSDAS